MRMRNAVLLALVVALVLGMGAVANAGTIPTLTASRTMVTYPHSAYLVSKVDTPSVIMRRLAGASEWTTYSVVPSGTAVRGVIRPKSTAAYEIVSDGVESAPVTISVAAQLAKPQVNGHGRRAHMLRIKGWIAPAHVGGNVQLTFYRWEKVGTTVALTRKGKGKGKGLLKTVGKYQWVQHGDPVDVTLTRQNSQKSKWSYKWTPDSKGSWKIVVSHEDVAHVRSSASARTVIKR